MASLSLSLVARYYDRLAHLGPFVSLVRRRQLPKDIPGLLRRFRVAFVGHQLLALGFHFEPIFGLQRATPRSGVGVEQVHDLLLVDLQVSSFHLYKKKSSVRSQEQVEKKRAHSAF